MRVCVEAQVCSCFAPGGTEGPEKRQAGMQPVRPVQDAFCLGSKVLSSLNTYACYLCEFYINTTIQTDINQLHKFLRKWFYSDFESQMSPNIAIFKPSQRKN